GEQLRGKADGGDLAQRYLHLFLADLHPATRLSIQRRENPFEGIAVTEVEDVVCPPFLREPAQESLGVVGLSLPPRVRHGGGGGRHPEDGNHRQRQGKLASLDGTKRRLGTYAERIVGELQGRVRGEGNTTPAREDDLRRVGGRRRG